MKRQEALDLISRYTTNIWNERDYSEAENLFSKEFVDHDPLPGQAEGYAGYLDIIRSLHTVCPRLEMRNDGVYIDTKQNFAVVRWSAKGSSQGTMFGLFSGKKPAQMKGIDVFRIEDGRISEHWGEFDALGLLK